MKMRINEILELEELKECFNFLLENNYNYTVEIDDCLAVITIYNIAIIYFEYDFDKKMYIKSSAKKHVI